MFSVTEKFDRIARHNGVYVYPVEAGVEIWETPYYLGCSFYKIFHPVKESERVQVGFVSWRVIEAGLCDWEGILENVTR